MGSWGYQSDENDYAMDRLYFMVENLYNIEEILNILNLERFNRTPCIIGALVYFYFKMFDLKYDMDKERINYMKNVDLLDTRILLQMKENLENQYVHDEGWVEPNRRLKAVVRELKLVECLLFIPRHLERVKKRNIANTICKKKNINKDIIEMVIEYL